MPKKPRPSRGRPVSAEDKELCKQLDAWIDKQRTKVEEKVTFTVDWHGQPVRTQGIRLGDLGAFFKDSHWRITHIPTGLGICSMFAKHKHAATKFLKACASLVNWSYYDNSDGRPVEPELRDACNTILARCNGLAPPANELRNAIQYVEFTDQRLNPPDEEVILMGEEV